MARLRVGEILIEDGNVSFDKADANAPAAPTAAPPSQPSPPQVARRPGPALRTIPGRPGLLAALGGLALVTGLVAVSLGRSAFSGAVPSISDIVLLLAGVPTTMAGIGLVGLASAKRLQSRRSAVSVASPHPGGSTMAPDLFEARMAKLSPLLLGDASDRTFEKLAFGSGMTEEALVDTLTLAEARGLLDEELNLETGEWYYRLVTTGGGRSTLGSASLDERRLALRARAQKESR